MNGHDASRIRNVALIGPSGAGKTTLCEALLASAGKIGRMGSVARGDTVSDFHPDEKEHGQSVHVSIVACEHLGRELRFIDCPGAPDFVNEMLVALRVADSAMIVTESCGEEAPDVGEAWEAARRCGIPVGFVINTKGGDSAAWERTLEQLRSRYGAKVFPLTLPASGPGDGRHGILDVMRSEVILYDGDGRGGMREQAASGAEGRRVADLHRRLIDLVAESDDRLLEAFLESGTLSEEDLRAHVHAAFQRGMIVPVFAVAAEANAGVSRLLDFVAKYGSSPADRAKVGGRAPDGSALEVGLDDRETTAYVFKTMHEPHIGGLSYLRVYSGEVVAGEELANATRGGGERIGSLYLLNGGQRQPVESLRAGEIGVAVKLRGTRTGDTLCHPGRMVSLPGVERPAPNTRGALVAADDADLNKLGEGLAVLHEEDPTFCYQFDPVLGQTIVSGQGWLQLTVVAEELRRRFRVEASLAEPGVAYRSTITARAESRHRHKKQTGGAGQFAEVWLRIEPLAPGSGVVFTHSLVGSNVDRVFVPSVERGVRAACAAGPCGGFPVTDVRVDFFDGKQHPVDSKDIAFQIAGKAAFEEAFAKARPRLLEPVMELRVRVPADAVGAVLADLSGRRGRVVGMESEGACEVVVAQVPQAGMYRYGSHLRSATSGRGRHTEEFLRYEEVPRELEAGILAAAAGARGKSPAPAGR